MPGFIETIELLSKSQSLRNGSAIEFAHVVLQKSLESLQCGRVNAWRFNNDKTQLISICSIKKPSGQIKEEAPLVALDMPNYFKNLKKNEIIVSNEARIEPMNKELLDGYLIPNDIMSMIDVPLRSDGEMIGVICFEHIGKIHKWLEEEKSFVQSVAQLLSLALETEIKFKYRLELERLVDQKQVLLSEINHRVKNNLAIIVSLLNFQKSKATDSEHSQLFEEVKNKVYSMSLLQQQLHTIKTVDRIDLGVYLNSLVQNLHSSYNHRKDIHIELTTCNLELDVTKAIPIGLIANEILTNSYKYAFGEKNVSPQLKVGLTRDSDDVQLTFWDNGPGVDMNVANNGMGFELVQDLVDQIEASFNLNSENGTAITIKFKSS